MMLTMPPRATRHVLTIVVLLLIASAVSAHAETAPDRLVFGGDRSYPPFEYLQDDAPSGFNVELGQALIAPSEVPVEHRLADWPEVVNALDAGEVDVVAMMVSPEREARYRFTTPFHYIEHAIYAREDVPPVYSVPELAGQRVTLESHSFAQRQLQVEQIHTELVIAATTLDALERLVQGEADYAILAAPIADHLVHTQGLPASRLGPPFWPRGYAFAVRADRPDLQQWLQQELELTIASGAYQSVYERWRSQLHPAAGDGRIARITLWGLALLLGLVVVVTGWSWILRRQVGARTRELKQALEQTREAESQARYLADYDDHTRLPKSRYFAQQVNAVLQDPDQSQSELQLVIMQLVELDELIGAFGRVYSQALIRHFAEALNRVSTGPCGYFDRGVFATLIERGTTQKLFQRLATVGQAEGQYVHFVAGAANYPEHGRSSETLTKCAETALAYSLSEQSTWTCYDPSLEPDPEDLEIVAQFRRDRHKGFYSVFQPQIDLQSDGVVGAEALVRWDHPKFGHLPPARFIPLIEKAGMISHITARMIDEAVRLAAHLRARRRPLVISVNIAVYDLLNAGLCQLVQQALERHGGDPADLKLELTESSFAGNDVCVSETLKNLSDLGVSLAIDDFGTGYSSLSYLSQFSVQELKIDRSFVVDMVTNRKHSSIVQSTISLAQHLGLSCVAEGAEDQATVELLKHYGCDYVQGYVFAKPLSEMQLMEFVEKRHNAAHLA